MSVEMRPQYRGGDSRRFFDVCRNVAAIPQRRFFDVCKSLDGDALNHARARTGAGRGVRPHAATSSVRYKGCETSGQTVSKHETGNNGII